MRNYRSAVLTLPDFHFLPADISVYVVGQKSGEAYDNGDIADIMRAGHDPQDDQHNVIGRISQCKKRASSEGQIDRYKAGGHRNGAWNNIRRAEVLQNEVKYYGHDSGQYPHKYQLNAAQLIYLTSARLPLYGLRSQEIRANKAIGAVIPR